MTLILSLIFFASGASALLFETLWFRQTGLMLGNSVWATSLVTSSFMGGLALGNLFAASRGRRSRRPLRMYAALEAAIGLTGLALVVILPLSTPLLAPTFTSLLDHPAVLNSVRLLIAFLLLLIPASAMGATLPILARALSVTEGRFGRVMGLLYGFNTLGAVAGALAGETFLIARFGLRGAGLCAAAINGVVVLAALWLSPRVETRVDEEGATLGKRARRSAPRWRLLAGAFLAGGILLSLEVVWFRLLLLFVFGTSLSFAVMLAVVLLGIGAGGLSAGLLLRADRDAWKWLSGLALGAGALTAWTYAALNDVLSHYTLVPIFFGTREVLGVAVPLMLPTSFVSGMLFTLMGAAVKDQDQDASEAAGGLAFANTLGAMLGPLLTTFVLLPGLGIENSIFALVCAYGLVSVLCALPKDLGEGAIARARLRVGSAAALFAAMVILFPFGLMRSRFALRPAAPYLAEGVKVAAYREGLTETITYLVRDLWGEATSYRLLTNAHSMSSSQLASARYMRMFVYLPVALREPRNALLISYGVGLTAKALTETASLESIDVVDVSRDILEMGRIVFPEPGTFPLDDRRVKVHVEDGRFFLLTTDRTYDLITAEPPPPKGSGIVNLYSKEYFELIRKRLAPGGLTTYWLPVYQLQVDESRAIMRGFCEVFEDCTLWAGSGLEWILMGSNDRRTAPSSEEFARQWRDARVGPELQGIGFVSPDLMGAAFIADAPGLREFIAARPALDDDHPLRVSPRVGGLADPLYFRFMDTAATRRRFESSPWIRARWPEALRAAAPPLFATQGLINRSEFHTLGFPPMTLAEIEATLTGTDLRVPVLSALLTSDPEIEAARHAEARGVSDPFVDELLAIGALADRDYARAAGRFERAERGDHASDLRPLRVLSLGLAGEVEAAERLLAAGPPAPTEAGRREWAWLARRFGSPSGAGRRVHRPQPELSDNRR